MYDLKILIKVKIHFITERESWIIQILRITNIHIIHINNSYMLRSNSDTEYIEFTIGNVT